MPACSGDDKQTGSSTPQPASLSLPQSDSSELHQCKRTSTQEAGTQTADIPARHTCDAWTQCSLISDSQSNTLNFLLPPVDRAVLLPATGGHPDPRDAEADSAAPTLSLRSLMSGGKQSRRKHSSGVNTLAADRRHSRGSYRKHVNFSLDGPCTTNDQGIIEVIDPDHFFLEKHHMQIYSI